MKGIERFVSMPLGMGSVFVPQRKEWIGTALATVGGTFASLLGGSAASSANRRSLKIQNELYHRNYAQDLRDYNENPLDRDDNQALITGVQKFNDRNWKKAEGAQAVGAGTHASTQMQKDAGNELMAQTTSNMAAQNQARKDAASRRMQDAATQHANAMSQAEQNRAQQITAATQAASNAMMGIGSAVDQATSAKTNLNGGSNNSTTVDIVNGTDIQPNDTSKAVDNPKETNIDYKTTDSAANDDYDYGYA